MAFEFSAGNSFFQASAVNLPTGNADRTLEMWVRLDVVPTDFDAMSHLY
jgi:hypothetical protein